MSHEDDYEEYDNEVDMEEIEQMSNPDQDIDEDDLDEIDLDSLLDDSDIEDIAEEEEVEEEKKEDEEEVEEEEVEEEEEEVEDDNGEDYGDDEEGGLGLHDVLGDDTVKPIRRQYIRIQRYCKSLSETNPRVKKSFSIDRDGATKVLEKFTTENNAKLFGSFVKDKTELFLLCGKILAKSYTNKELFVEVKNKTSEWDTKLYEKQRKIEEREIEIATTEMKVVKGLYTCGRCKSEKTYSRQVQTRSADEGMTSIIQCANCGKVWREYA